MSSQRLSTNGVNSGIVRAILFNQSEWRGARLRLPRCVGEELLWSTSSKEVFAVCKVLAVGAQGFLLSLPEDRLVALCSFVGLGGPQMAAVDNHREEVAKGGSQLFRAFGVDLPEILPGLLVQPSLFALTFAYTDRAGQCKQLLSLAVSCVMALKAVVEVALTIVKNWMEMLGP